MILSHYISSWSEHISLKANAELLRWATMLNDNVLYKFIYLLAYKILTLATAAEVSRL